MLILAEIPGDLSLAVQAATSLLFVVMTTAAVYFAWPPMKDLILRQEQQYGQVLRSSLLLDISPRAVTVSSAVAVVLLGALGFILSGSWIGLVIAATAGAVLPGLFLKIMRRRRLRRLERQLVGAITSLTAGVKAGLNLIQGMQLVARDGPVPICQEFRHLLREYEYGIPLEEAMENAAVRIGSGDFRLLFAALQTHRERGGDLGGTLERIADSIREIQRLENRVETLTAQGRATARWLGMMPLVIGGIYYLIDSSGVVAMFEKMSGNMVLLIVIVLNILGFLWIRKIVAIDI
jgi:tight adherence protein B